MDNLNMNLVLLGGLLLVFFGVGYMVGEDQAVRRFERAKAIPQPQQDWIIPDFKTLSFVRKKKLQHTSLSWKCFVVDFADETGVIVKAVRPSSPTRWLESGPGLVKITYEELADFDRYPQHSHEVRMRCDTSYQQEQAALAARKELSQ